MKTRSLFLASCIILLALGCSQGQKLAPKPFADKIAQTTGATLLDVRTPEEFAGGHLANAKNADWNGDHFEHQLMALDKTKPVFVYCLKGSRSASAATRMRTLGFKEVYELDGGLEKWQSAKLPVTRD